MSFNTPTFSITGMMPTRHPVQDSINEVLQDGSINYVFSTTTDAPETVSFRITDGSGRLLMRDDPGECYVRSGNANTFVFGGVDQGYLPVGTFFLWVKANGLVSKHILRNLDNAFNLGSNSFTADSVLLIDTEIPPAFGDIPGVYNWPSILTGDTFGGISALQIVVNGSAPPYAVTSVRIHFRKIRGSTTTPDLSLSTDDDTILITNAATWILSIPAFVVNLDPGIYYYDLETTNAPGTIKTYISGSWTIHPDNTH